MKYCPNCGKTLPIPEAKFCPECGAPIIQPPEGSSGTPLEPHKPSQPANTQARASHRLKKDPYTLELPDDPPVKAGHSASSEDLWDRAMQDVETDPVAAGAPAMQTVRTELLREAEPVRESEVYDPLLKQLYEEDQLDSDQNLPPEPPRKPHVTQLKKQERPPRTKQKRTKPGVGRIWIIIALSLLVLAGVAGGIALKVIAADAPEKAATAFVQAVVDGDVSSVLAAIDTADSGISSASDVKQFCEDLRDSVDGVTLKKHLLGTFDEKAGVVDSSLSCLTMRQTVDTLFTQRFKVQLSPIQVLLEAGLPDVSLYIDNAKRPADAKPTEQGLLLSLAPGKHTIRVVYEGYGQQNELGSAEVESFVANAPQQITLRQTVSVAQVELAGTETHVQAFANGSPIHLDAASGFVVVDPAFEGMEIKIQCDQYTQSFQVGSGGQQNFQVDYIATLEEQNPGAQNLQPSALSNRQLMDHVSTRFYGFYASYLNAINQWDKRLIKNASDAYYDEAVEKMESFNQGLLYKLYGIVFDRNSLQRSEQGGELFVTFQVQPIYDYAYQTAPEAWLKGGNSQTVTMHYNQTKAQWEVYGAIIVNDLPFSTNTFRIDA